ncbi:MAG: DUF2917 domain-containing protein [Propionivibrio sp.]|uniref:DUF2917 domain-containing protein n=1 Tax=Propionivibrio sp. TaxID=2212460 RepID=UPI001A473C4F|nr:DUF2917 domain-containing protein [Propionivibrio sp.]MBL8414372.1 DUF2917 domain-containing protein [Propionivibrio sp.]
MNTLLSNQASPLAAGEIVAFRGARGSYLECTQGMVWLTIEGQPGDFYLEQGSGLRIESNGLVLIEGMPTGEIRQTREVPWPIHWTSRLLSTLQFRKSFSPRKSGVCGHSL